ncbi:MAG TPA: CDP-alcohol phosphatidyltransferase family protein [Ilumatobacteraceae bacterium]|nr:CDP-alcohol phosphatidyltransferase family protein [Ilumatobacteraceae bacterium]
MTVDPTRIATWANLVTVARMFISPVVFIAFPDDGKGSWLALLVWFLLCFSDGIDGFLARRHGPTNFGTFVDPLADKLLVLLAMITLIDSGQFWWVPVAIIFARELAMSLYRVFWGTKGVNVPASKLAKIKTTTQQFAVAFAIAPLTAVDAMWTWKVLLWTSVVLTVYSFIQYMWRAHRAKEAGLDDRPVDHPASA